MIGGHGAYGHAEQRSPSSFQAATERRCHGERGPDRVAVAAPDSRERAAQHAAINPRIWSLRHVEPQSPECETSRRPGPLTRRRHRPSPATCPNPPPPRTAADSPIAARTGRPATGAGTTRNASSQVVGGCAVRLLVLYLAGNRVGPGSVQSSWWRRRAGLPMLPREVGSSRVGRACPAQV